METKTETTKRSDPRPELGQPVVYVDSDGREHDGFVTKTYDERKGKLGRHPYTHPPCVDIRLWSGGLQRTVAAHGTPHAKTGEPIERQCYRSSSRKGA